MQGRYRKAGETAGQLAIAALVLVGLLGSACLVACLLIAATFATS